MERFAFLLLLTLANLLFGTNVYFNDSITYSPNELFKLEATSPDNANNGDHPFQSGFIYKLYNTETNSCLWSRKQPMKINNNYRIPTEGSPEAIYINNKGYVIIKTSLSLIIVGIDGKDRGIINIFGQALTQIEQDKYVANTTAGSIWEGHSLWYFADYNEVSYFIIRTYWGRRIIIDINKGIITKEFPKLDNFLLAEETDYIETTLKAALKEVPAWENGEEKSKNTFYDAMTCAFIAGQLKINQVIPYLREFEKSNYTGSSVFGIFDRGLDDGEVDRTKYSTFDIRHIAHLSLRRLGQKPTSYPCTQFYEYHKDFIQKPYIPTKLKNERHTLVSHIQKGMKPRELLNTIGAPDIVSYNDEWLYDMDSEKPYTLIITWDGNIVSKINTISPPHWQTDKWDIAINTLQ